jgi:tetratricopeptide (TPR) repeat protein
VWDVFLSYAGAEHQRAITVAEALRGAGLKVWFDRDDLRDHETITERLADGLARSRAFLALYSPTYHRRRACQWELASAWLAGAVEAQRGDATRAGHRVMVARCGSDLPSGVEGHKRFADADDLPALVTGVKAYLETLPEAPMGVPPLPKRAEGMPPPPTRFVGRTNEMWDLHVSLQGNTTVLSGSTNAAKGGHGLAQVQGCGGMGKTLLATEYVDRFGAAWPGGVFWLRAGGPDGKDNHLAQLIDQLQDVMLLTMDGAEVGPIFEGLKSLPPEKMILALKKKLADVLPSTAPWLWVVDDLPLGLNADEARQWLAPAVAGNCGRTLITTRSQGLGGVGQTVPVQELDPDAAYALLTVRKPPQGDEEEATAKALCQTLGYYALAIDIAGALRELVYDSYHALAEAITSAPAKVYDNKIALDLPNDYSENVIKTLRLSLQACSPESLTLLKMAACLAPGVPIPCDLLKAAGASAPEEAAALLKRASLVTFEQGTVSLHAAVAHSVRLNYQDAQESRPALVDALINIFETAPTLGTLESQQVLTPILPHVDAITSDPKTESEIGLLIIRGLALNKGGLLAFAREVEERAVKAAQTTLGAEHPATLTCMNNLAETLWAQGDPAAARRLEEEVYSVRRRVLGPEHPATLTSMNNLASMLMAQGDPAAARRLEEEVYSVRRRVLGSEHPATLTSMNNLASTLMAQGDPAAARRLEEEALSVSRRVLGSEHPATLTRMNNLAGTLWAQGDPAAARRLEEEALSVSRRVLGSEHPATLTSMNNLAETLWAQGDHAAARCLQEEALSVRRRVLGSEHHSTLGSIHNLACTLWEMGDHQEAISYWETALPGFERVLGVNHSTTETVRNVYSQAKAALQNTSPT